MNMLSRSASCFRLVSLSFTSIAAVIGVTTLYLAGCAATIGQSPMPAGSQLSGRDASGANLAPRASASAPLHPAVRATVALPAGDAGNRKAQPPLMRLGTNEMVQQLRPLPERIVEPGASNTPINFNIENGDIREVVRNVLGDALGENYMIDPRVVGTLSIRTPKGLMRKDLIPTLEMLLRTVNASLVKDGSIWRVLPSADAVAGLAVPRLGWQRNQGASVVIRPVRHIGAKELQRVMRPFIKGAADTAVVVDEFRNLLFITGTEHEVGRLLQIAEMFDIDVMAGMSFLLFPLQSAEAKTVLSEWEKVFPASQNPFQGLLRIVPIERMNAILLVSPQESVILQAQELLEKLDKSSDVGGGARLYVYHLQHTQATKLQAILQAALGARTTGTGTQATVAPGQTPSTLRSTPLSPISGQSAQLPGNLIGNPAAATASATSSGSGGGLALARQATVIADPDKNALLIVTTPSEYSAIEGAIKKLDTPTKQVAIDFAIAEVKLVGDLQFGLQSYLSGKLDSAANKLSVNNGAGKISGAGLSYNWGKASVIQAVLTASQTRDSIRVVSQPTLVTLDNQKATFTAGDQISVRTQTQSASANVNSVDSFQYISTGLSVTVTPRVSGENVFLEINQEISEAGTTTETNPNPNIAKRSQQSSVVVRNGDTMLMGGLYQNKSKDNRSGLPGLSAIPVLGGLFGSQGWQDETTELVMLITPRVMADADESAEIVDDLRRRLQGIEQRLPSVGTRTLPARAADKMNLSILSQSTDAPSLKITTAAPSVHSKPD